MNSTFTKNLLTLITGNAIALIIPVILYPIISRIFTPEDYALFGLYFSIFSFLEIASVGRYDFAVVMPENEEDAINIMGGGLLIASLYSLVILLLVLLLKDMVAIKLNSPSLANWLFLLPFGLLLISVSKLFNGWLIRISKFKASATNRASQKIAEVSVALTLGIFKIENGLILGDLSGRLFNAIFSFYQSIRSGFDPKKILEKSIKINLKRYSEIPKYSILPSLLNTLGGMFPVFIISSFYSVEASGSFNFSRTILGIPFALISSGVSQVLMQQISEKKNKKQPISKELISLAIKLFALTVIAVIPLSLAGPELFELIFGIKWKLSGEFTSILIFSYAISFIISPFSILLIILGKIRWTSLWQILYFFAISFFWLLSNLTIKPFLITLVIFDVLAYLIYGILVYKTIRHYEKSLVTRLL